MASSAAVRGSRFHARAAVAALALAVIACGGGTPAVTTGPPPTLTPPPATDIGAPATAGIDTTFGDGGLAFTDMGGTDDHAYAVVVAPDGSTFVAGEARPDENNLVQFALVKFAPDGSQDVTFPKLYTPFGSGSSAALAVALQSDGKIVMAGHAPNPEAHHDTFAVARYTADGSLDTTFGDQGLVMTAIYPDTGAGPEDRANAVAVDSQGRIVVAGESGSFFYDFAVARYNADGSLDDTFGDGGVVVTDFGGDDRAKSIAVQPDGAILVGGSGWIDSNAEDFALARYLHDGSLDASFGAGGVVATDFRGGDDTGKTVLLRPDGRIALAGTIQLSGGCTQATCERYGFGLAQYNADGTPDSTFGTEGRIEPDYIVSSGAYAAVLMPDGVIGLVGHIGNEDFGLAFVDSAGAPILIEDGSEAARIDFQGGSDRAFGAALGPNNSVVLAGDASTPDGAFDFGLARYIAP